MLAVPFISSGYARRHSVRKKVNMLALLVNDASPKFGSYDFCTELVEKGELPPGAREDRAVVAYGYSRTASTKRDASRIKGFPGSDERGDRGHLAAHAFFFSRLISADADGASRGNRVRHPPAGPHAVGGSLRQCR
jgi:hypothetical protein